jgi:hypothetical protein
MITLEKIFKFPTQIIKIFVPPPATPSSFAPTADHFEEVDGVYVQQRRLNKNKYKKPPPGGKKPKPSNLNLDDRNIKVGGVGPEVGVEE